MRRLAISVLVVLGAVAMLGGAAPAGAHVPDGVVTGALVPIVGEGVERAASAIAAPVDVVAAVARTPGAVSWLPLLILTAVLVGACRPRRAVVCLLVALLTLFVFEAGRHSAHHLGAQRDAARCVVESVSSNLSGAVGEPMAVLGPLAIGDITPHLDPVVPPHGSLRPDQGRAPPFLA
jgi:hypothetical protein